MIGHNANRIANGTGTLRLHPALISAQPAIDADTSRERVYSRLVKPVISADSTRHELHLNVVRSELAEPDQRTDVNLGSYLHLLAAKRLHMLNRNCGPGVPNPPLPARKCSRPTAGGVEGVAGGCGRRVQVGHVLADHP
jgi:hypothetical protein